MRSLDLDNRSRENSVLKDGVGLCENSNTLRGLVTSHISVRTRYARSSSLCLILITVPLNGKPCSWQVSSIHLFFFISPYSRDFIFFLHAAAAPSGPGLIIEAS